MENFTKMDCGCYVGFDVNHKPVRGKQCPLHEASKDMYAALKAARSTLSLEGYEASYPTIVQVDKALSKAREGG